MSPAQLCMLLVWIGCSSQAEAGSPKTQLHSSYERVFSRRKRAIIFPPGSFFKFTLNFGKGLLSTYPRGIAFNLEEAVYFPIPGTRDDLYPKRFLPKTTTTAKPKTTKPVTFVYIPGTDWRFKAQALPKPKYGLKTDRIDYGGLGNSYKWQQKSKYNANYTQKWQMNRSKWSKWTTPAPQWTASWRRSQPVDENQRHFHGHRDRRQLFEHFSGLSALCVSEFQFSIRIFMDTLCSSPASVSMSSPAFCAPFATQSTFFYRQDTPCCRTCYVWSSRELLSNMNYDLSICFSQHAQIGWTPG